MKHTILLLSTLLCVLPLQAQRVRNKPFDVTLRDYTIDEVVQLFGKPVQIDSGLIDDGLAVEYPHAQFYYFAVWNNTPPEGPWGEPDYYAPDGFSTDSPDFCFFSDCFPGGIRVGDRIERIRKLDIVHSRVGKGRPENALRKMDWKTENDHFEILGAEYDHFYLEVKDSVVCSIDWDTPIDWDRLNGGFLWKVEADDLPSPSYLLGIFPGAPASALQRITGLDKAWDAVKAVYWQDPELGPWGGTMTDEMFLRDGKKLEDLYRREDYRDIQDYVKQLTGFRPEELWWSPDGLTRFLMNRLVKQTMAEYADGKPDMGATLYNRAVAEGKEVHVLGSAFHIESSRTPGVMEEDEKELLQLVRDPGGKPEAIQADIRHLYDAYLTENQDEVGYFLYYAKKYSPLRTNAANNCNYHWDKELKQAMRKGPALVIVDFTDMATLRELLGDFAFWEGFRIEPLTLRK